MTPRGRSQAPRVGRAASMNFMLSTSLEVNLPPEVADLMPATIALVGAAWVLNSLKSSVDGPPPLAISQGSLAGRTIVITGANTGLGYESAVRLAEAGARVVVTARTERKALETEGAIRAASGSSDVHGLVLDLADLASIRAFADELRTKPYGTRLDVLVNNAGVMAVPNRTLTRDGFEAQVGVNHLGHFALTGLLLPLLRSGEGYARVVTVSSKAHLLGDAQGLLRTLSEDGSGDSSYEAWSAYGVSKLANVVFSKELDRRFRLHDIRATAVALHPGLCPTSLARYVVSGDDRDLEDWVRELPGPAQGVMRGLRGFLRPVSRGANTHVYLAAGSDGGGGYACSGGEYFEDMQPAQAHSEAASTELGARLWDASERLTGVSYGLPGVDSATTAVADDDAAASAVLAEATTAVADSGAAAGAVLAEAPSRAAKTYASADLPESGGRRIGARIQGRPAGRPARRASGA